MTLALRSSPPPPASGLCPEAELLLCCARTTIPEATARRARSLLQQELDWTFLIRIAYEHGVLPLLDEHLNRLGAEAIPPEALTHLRYYSDRSARRGQFLTEELLRLLDLLRRHGIPAVPFKGPVLATALYGGLTRRPFSDLDLLVHPRDVTRAGELILSLGYDLRTPRTAAQEAIHRRTSYCTKYVRADGPVILELHWSFRPSDLPLHLHHDRLWEQLESVALAGTTVSSLRPELLLLLLCAHGGGHRWAALKWLCDVNELLRVHPGLDWAWLLREARRTGAERMLLLGLRLAQELLGTVLPTEVQRRLAVHPVVEQLVDTVRLQLFEDGDALPPAARRMEERAYLFRLRERPWDRALYCLQLARAAITPGEEERAAFRLPAPLSPLYYLIRPLRLMGKYGLLLLRRSA